MCVGPTDTRLEYAVAEVKAVAEVTRLEFSGGPLVDADEGRRGRKLGTVQRYVWNQHLALWVISERGGRRRMYLAWPSASVCSRGEILC